MNLGHFTKELPQEKFLKQVIFMLSYLKMDTKSQPFMNADSYWPLLIKRSKEVLTLLISSNLFFLWETMNYEQKRPKQKTTSP